MNNFFNNVSFSDLVAFSALFLAIYQGYLTRKHYRLSSLPHISFRNIKIKSKEYSIKIISNGNGVAIIKNIYILVNGEKRPFSNESLMDVIEYQNPIIRTGILVASGCSDDMLMPGEEIVLIKSDLSKQIDVTSKMINDVSDKIRIIIEYESIYNQKFISKNW